MLLLMMMIFMMTCQMFLAEAEGTEVQVLLLQPEEEAKIKAELEKALAEQKLAEEAKHKAEVEAEELRQKNSVSKELEEQKKRTLETEQQLKELEDQQNKAAAKMTHDVSKIALTSEIHTES